MKFITGLTISFLTVIFILSFTPYAGLILARVGLGVGIVGLSALSVNKGLLQWLKKKLTK